MATYQELRTRSQQVRDEQNIGGNTALRVGQLLMDIVKYFYDNDAAASEYLQQHFAMVNDGTQLLNWKQSPIVILHTMGETYDEGDFSALSQGENYYRAGFIMEANGQGGGINGETPKANVLYVNLANDALYTWNGASFDAITSGGGGGVSVSYNASTKTTNIVVGAGASAETTPTPVISVSDANEGKQVAITAATGAVIRYTTDGSDPTSSSPVYSSPITINTAGTHTIKAVAKVSGKLMSEVATEMVTLAGTEQPTIDTSETASAVTVTATLADATVYISTDGETWTSGSGSASLTISKTSSTQQVTVYAYAKASGMIASQTLQQQVTVAELPNNKFSGTASAAVTSITIKGTTYTNTQSASDPYIVNTQNGSVFDWEIDFGDTVFSGAISYDGSSIKSIFNDKTKIKSISHMPDSWSSIGSYAFWCEKCTNGFVVGKNITTFLGNACTNLGVTNLVIPSTVNSIQGSSFRSCGSQNIYLNCSSIAQAAFADSTKARTVEFSENVTSVGNYLFMTVDLTYLSSVTFRGATPPTFGGQTLFGSSQASDFAIYVPAASVDAYKSALPNWAEKITAITE